MKAGTYKEKLDQGGVDLYIIDDRCPATVGIFRCKRRVHKQGMHECPYSTTETAVWNDSKNGS